MKTYQKIIIGIIFFLSILFLGLHKYFSFNNNFKIGSFGTKIFPFQYDRQFFSELDQGNALSFVAENGKNYMFDCKKNNKLCIFLPYQEVFSNFLRIKNIQFVGKNVFADYYSGLYLSLDNITTLSPYRQYPYIFGQYILPIQKTSENSDENQKKISRIEAINIGEKGIKFLCDENKIQNISSLSEENFLQEYQKKSEPLSNPCPDFQLPHSLGFNYYFYLNNFEKSIENYKLASFSKNAPEITVNMPAIIAGRLNEHTKSAQMWFEKFLATKKIYQATSNQNEKNNLEKQMEKFIKKALMEYTLQLIIEAENGQNECAKDLECLQKKGYISEKIQNQNFFCILRPNEKLNEMKSFHEVEVIEGNLPICSGPTTLDKQILNEMQKFVISKAVRYKNGNNLQLTEKINCEIFKFGIENNFLNLNGDLVYPLDENMQYGRRPDYDQRRIIPSH